MKKLLGKFLIIGLPVVICVILLLPTFRSSELENKQKEAIAAAQSAANSADSLAIIEKFEKDYGESFKSAKQSRLKLGLDLRGGMYVTLEADVIRLLEESAQKGTTDDVFNEIIERTKKETADNDLDVMETFQKIFKDITSQSAKKRLLSDYFDFGDQGDLAKVEESIIKHLKDNEKEAIDQAVEVIRQRIDKFGVSEPTIQKQGSRRIMLELPGVTNENEMRQLLQTTARLEFKLVKNDENVVSAFYKIDKLLARKAKLGRQDSTLVSFNKNEADSIKAANKKDTLNKDNNLLAKSDVSKSDSNKTNNETEKDSTAKDSTKAASTADTANPYAGLSEDETRQRYQEDHPFTTLFETYYVPDGKTQRPQRIGYTVDAFNKGNYNFQIFEPGLKKFNVILAMPEVRDLLPDGIQILRSAKPETYKDKNSSKDFKAWYFYALKKESELGGDVITNAIATYDQTTNEPVVSMTMNSDGSDRWARITGANIKKRIAIVLDDQVYSAPVVQNKIVGGSSQITGMANADEAKLLKIVLKAGALKAPVQIIEERVVGPSLGEDSIRDGLTAIAFAALLVVLFMFIYYATAGFVANAAVILNIFIIVAILAAFQGTLSLPGIAGMTLTLGMAVDANILVYERIREELRKGRSLRSAIDEGFKRAMTAILDTNTTTFITGLILYFFGTGPIQGFAMTLMIGIFATLFTQIVVTRSIIEILISRGATEFNFGQPKQVSI